MIRTSVNNNKKRKLEKAIIVFMLIASFLAAGWFLFGYSDYKTLSGTLITNKSLKQDISAMQELHKDKNDIKNSWLILEEENRKLATLLPDYEQLPEVIEALEGLLQQHGDAIQTLQTAETKTGTNHTTLNFTLSAKGTPFTLQDILVGLESFPHLLIIDKILWRDSDEGNAELQTDFRLVFTSTAID